jgi:hypothetical protein
MGGALKLGVAAGVAYTFGGHIGPQILLAIKKDASVDAQTGAQWAGRIVLFAGLIYLGSKL